MSEIWIFQEFGKVVIGTAMIVASKVTQDSL
jgi:hypothetical protein